MESLGFHLEYKPVHTDSTPGPLNPEDLNLDTKPLLGCSWVVISGVTNNGGVAVRINLLRIFLCGGVVRGPKDLATMRSPPKAVNLQTSCPEAAC